MVGTELNLYLKKRISKILTDTSLLVDDRLLLRAYYTFLADQKRTTHNRIIEIGLDMSDSVLYQDIRKEFLQWESLFEFMRFVIPGYICEPERIEQHFGFFELDHLILQIFACKEVDVRTQRINSEIRKAMYRDYISAAEKYNVDSLDEKSFMNLFYSINSFTLNMNWPAEPEYRLNPYAEEAVSILNNTLLVSKSKQYSDCAQLYNRAPLSTIVESFQSNFCSLSDSQIKKVYGEVSRKLMKAQSPLDAICTIYLGKRTHNTAANIAANDVVMENSFVYHNFTSQLKLPYISMEHHIVFSPSPFFVKKLAQDFILRGIHITFVVADGNVKSLYDLHFGNRNYCGSKGENFSFMTYDDFYDQLRKQGKYQFKSSLIFANSMSDFEKKKLYHEMNHYQELTEGQNFFVLSSERDFAQCMRAQISRIKLQEADMIADGIANSTLPRRKVFWKYTGKVEDLENDAFSVRRMKFLSSKRELQQMASVDALEVTEMQFVKSGFELRRMFEQPQTALTGKSRRLPRHIRFSNEIEIWYSTTKNLAYPDQVRVEAYVCELMPEGKEERGFMPRGNRISESVKRYTKVSESEINHWLIEEYPYSSRGKGTKGISEIREAIATYYRDYYAAKNTYCDISLRTLWYIYSELQDILSESEYSILSELAKGQIGELNTAYSNLDDYMRELNRMYPAIAEAQLERKVNVLYMALELAVEKNHAIQNPIENFVNGNDVDRKRYFQVLAALTKKSFTKEEFGRVFQRITWNINHGRYEFVGLMIKLLTGLDNNIVCGLMWKDFVEIDEYAGLYSLFVYQQLSNDGNVYMPLRATKEYRCVPCCDILKQYLIALRKKVKEAYPETYLELPIVTGDSKDESHDWRTKISPKQLYQIAQKMVESLKIEDVTLEIPYVGKGTKARNLNQYYGDIFKSNFRHYSLIAAKMSLDEIAYLLGIKPETTFGNHYCDFRDESSQLSLMLKINRIAALLIGKNVIIEVTDDLFGKTPVKRFLAEGEQPIEVALTIESSEDIEMDIDSRFGISVQIDRY